jgi:hypothetical protein
MLKHVALALFLAPAALPALAQTTPAPAPTAAATGQYQYCNLVSFGTQGRDTRLEYGQHPKPVVANPEMEALDEKVKELGSSVLALNYLTSHGWEYLNTASLSPPGNSGYIIYLLRRRTQ